MFDQETRFAEAQMKIEKIQELLEYIETFVDGCLTPNHKKLIKEMKELSNELYEEFEF